MLVVYTRVGGLKRCSLTTEKWADQVHLVFVGTRGFLSFFFFYVSSGPDFHGKAALINMALKPGTFYFLRKDHSKAFRVLLRTLASAV